MSDGMRKMSRQRNVEWEPPNEWPHVNLQVLMDIREELQRLNVLLHCPNFTGIPTTLRKIAINTAKKRAPKEQPK